MGWFAWLAQTPAAAAAPQLRLRDIHLPPEPAWWPPAPGWWILCALVMLGLLLFARWLQRRWRQHARLTALRAQFDRAAIIDDPVARVAAISELLRRAARVHDADATQLQGADWLRFLDGGDAAAEFTHGPGRILIDGAYRPRLEAHLADALLPPARRRFLQLLEKRR